MDNITILDQYLLARKELDKLRENMIDYLNQTGMSRKEIAAFLGFSTRTMIQKKIADPQLWKFEEMNKIIRYVEEKKALEKKFKG